MTGFDIIVLLIVGLAAIGGFMRGFVHEVLALLAWALAAVAIRFLHADLTDLIFGYLDSPNAAAILAFGLLVLIPYFVVKLIAGAAGWRTRRSVLGPFDRVLGFGFGAVKGVMIVVFGFSLLVLGYDTVWGANGRPAWMVTSRTYPFINASSEAMVQLVRERQDRLEREDDLGESAVRP